MPTFYNNCNQEIIDALGLGELDVQEIHLHFCSNEIWHADVKLFITDSDKLVQALKKYYLLEKAERTEEPGNKLSDIKEIDISIKDNR